MKREITRLTRSDVVADRLRFLLHLLQPLLYDVADRDDADQLALLDHRHVAEFAFVIRSITEAIGSSLPQVTTLRVID